jgi:hypothetical protein
MREALVPAFGIPLNWCCCLPRAILPSPRGAVLTSQPWTARYHLAGELGRSLSDLAAASPIAAFRKVARPAPTAVLRQAGDTQENWGQSDRPRGPQMKV